MQLVTDIETYDPISLPMVSNGPARIDQPMFLILHPPPPHLRAYEIHDTDLRLEMITAGGSCNASLEWGTFCSACKNPSNG